jgi:hypothetical protein
MRRLACCLPVLLLCACGYRLQGRVVEGGFGTVTVVDDADDRLQAAGVQGVRVQLVRDPNRLRREVVASATSNRDGVFALETKTFGAGWTDERWEIVATRPGYGPAQSPIELPIDPGPRRLLVELERGGMGEVPEPTGTRSVIDEASKYDPSIKSRGNGSN